MVQCPDCFRSCTVWSGYPWRSGAPPLVFSIIMIMIMIMIMIIMIIMIIMTHHHDHDGGHDDHDDHDRDHHDHHHDHHDHHHHWKLTNMLNEGMLLTLLMLWINWRSQRVEKRRLIQRIILHIWKWIGNTFCSKNTTMVIWLYLTRETKGLKYSNIWNMIPVIFIDFTWLLILRHANKNPF